jgi:hypothetical protein
VATIGGLAMSNKNKKPPPIQLPKDAISRVDLGDAFAEHDKVLQKQPSLVFVKTPAIEVAMRGASSKCFFIGRRGTGKTAITFYIATNQPKSSFQLHPQLFVPTSREYDLDKLRDTRQQYFKSLVNCFKRAILLEVVSFWTKKAMLGFQRLGPMLTRERNNIENETFDTRLLSFLDDTFAALENKQDKQWVKHINRAKEISEEMDKLIEKREASRVTLMIDKIDEAWDGSDKAVVFLMGLMHACVELNASSGSVRPLLFLRENIFERVRQIDNEFMRLETSIVSLDWTQEQLLEVVERRLNAPFTGKLPLHGETWDHFFESLNDESSRHFVFTYCQERPRELVFCSIGIEAAKSHMRDKVAIEDLQEARQKFSESRLKDLSDEYSENYPQIGLVLSRFYGLGQFWTLQGIDSFIKRLLVDNQTKDVCKKWIFQYTAPERFLHLMYSIGFMGIGDKDSPQYRPLGAGTGSLPSMDEMAHIVVHPSYVDALRLRNVVMNTLGDDFVLTNEGIVLDLPEGINLDTYSASLTRLESQLKDLPRGTTGANTFEDIVGEIITLSFYRSLSNVQDKVREVAGCVIRDWIASNTATHGFWEMVRLRYHSTQVVWECKNYDDLKAEDFQQVHYYMTKAIGYFVVIAFRGEMSRHYFDHIKRINSEANGLVLLLTERDLLTFIRQARNGKTKETHIQEIYDKTVREIS